MLGLKKKYRAFRTSSLARPLRVTPATRTLKLDHHIPDMTAFASLNFTGELHLSLTASLETGNCWNRITRTSSNIPTYTWVLLPRLGLQSFFHASKSPRFQHYEPPPLPLAPLSLPTYGTRGGPSCPVSQSVSQSVQSSQTSRVWSAPVRFSSVQLSSARGWGFWCHCVSSSCLFVFRSMPVSLGQFQRLGAGDL